MNTTYRKNLKDVAIACKNYVDNAINDLRWELGSHTLDVESDTTIAFSKSVPNYTIGCQINKVGGMSYKSENLLVLNDVAETTTNGITYKVENGVITLNGTATSDFNISLSISLSLVAGTYTHCQCVTFPSGLSSNLGISGSAVDGDNVALKYSRTFSPQSSVTSSAMYYVIKNGTTFSNLTLYPMLVTGSTSPTEFKPYFSGIRDSAVTQITLKDSNNETKSTISIPSAIQNLDGYGWGISESVCNYIDYATKKFVQKVGRVDLGTLNYTISNANDPNLFWNDDIRNLIKPPLNTSIKVNAICSIYEIISYDTYVSQITNNILYCSTAGGLRIKNTSYSTGEAFKSAMNGVYLYYELATPVETDISSYITDDDKYIDVVPSGTITFDNTYENDVPSDITYLIEEVKA